MEKRADNLFAKLETIRGILDRIAQSQTDKMVKSCINSSTDHMCMLSVLRVCCVCVCAGYAGVSGRSGGPEALS